MTLAALIDRLPPWASDTQENLKRIFAQPELSPEATWSIALASALACRCRPLRDAVAAEAKSKISPVQYDSARAAFALMSMNNVFYSGRHLSHNSEIQNVPARLRMSAIKNHGGDAAAFELACTAVSSINGCEACLRFHQQKARDNKCSAEAIVAAIRIASVLHAAASVIEAES